MLSPRPVANGKEGSKLGKPSSQNKEAIQYPLHLRELRSQGTECDPEEAGEQNQRGVGRRVWNNISTPPWAMS